MSAAKNNSDSQKMNFARTSKQPEKRATASAYPQAANSSENTVSDILISVDEDWNFIFINQKSL